MASTEVHCVCGQPYDPQKFMIQCDNCKEWYHGSCVGVKEYESYDIDKYFCATCQVRCGPVVYKPILNWHRRDYSDPDAASKLVETGTSAFINSLKTRVFPSGESIILRLRGQQLTLPYLHQQGFSQPILVDGKDGLGLHVPQESFTVQDVQSYIDSDRVMDVIDVTKQADLRMTLGDFVQYFNNPIRHKVFNVISLEFSDTDLSALVEAPYIARKLCWANNLWPRDWSVERPEVQKYCLMGVKDSYTDFHIDFGGSSVWYHVLQGEKVFFMVPPTPTNLSLYQRWMMSKNQSETFFGDLVENCFKVLVQTGQTLLIPTGWIHAVWTTKDSLVFGGNFLHNLNIALQLQVYEIEKATQAPRRFRFPLFETLHWLAADRLVEDLRDMNAKGSRCPEHLMTGVRALLTALKKWAQQLDNPKAAMDPIPSHISVPKLLKDLQRELRHAERNAGIVGVGGSAAPPASEPVISNSPVKGTRRKPLVRPDFVDINEALSNFAAEEERLSKVENDNDIKPLRLTLPKSRFSNAKDPSLNKTEVKTTGPRLKLLLSKNAASHVKEPRDSDEEEFDGHLVIDEERRQLKKQAQQPAKIMKTSKSGSLKIRLSVGARSDDSESSNPLAKNGIEDLLRASHLTGKEPAADLDANRDSGRTSPSTREAVVGMLTMSQGFASSTMSGGTKGASDIDGPPLPSVAQKRRKGRRRIGSSMTDEYDDVMSKVHQDEDYIYLSLDASDEETDRGRYHKRKGGANSDDESWNPKARVGPVIPKMNRPVREGVKRPAVEKVLEAAALKRAAEPPAKRPYKKKRPRSPSVDLEPQAGTSASSKALPSIKMDSKLMKKPKKGMATAKQRLGKILKIHKMMH